jgi:DNA processing protein
MDREVFAMPGSIHSPLSRGPHSLIQQGAKLVENATDILSELEAFCVPQTLLSPMTTTDSSRKAPPRSPVWDAIGYDPVSEDILQQRTKMLPAILQCELLTLELNGDIERRPNGWIVRARRRSKTSD